MALEPQQIKWIRNFAGMEALKRSEDQERALKAKVVAEIRKKLAEERERLRDAMTFDVKVDGKKLGQWLDGKGTQLNEVDFTQIGKGFQLSQERVAKVHHAQVVIAELTESMKRRTVERVDLEGRKVTVRLFSDQEIADELYTPLVRERIVPETIVGGIYSETQKMLDETNTLYLAKIKEKQEAGELDEYDRIGQVINLGSGLAKIGANLADTFTGVDAKFAKDVLELCALGLETGSEVRDAIKNSGFPDATHSIVDNIGSIVGKVVELATGDKDLAQTVASAYKASTAVIQAGAHFAKGEAGLNDGLQALAGGLSEVADLVEIKEVQQGLLVAATGLANSGSGYNIGKSLATGDTKGVIDGLTAAAKANLSMVVKIETLEKSQGLSEEEQEALQKSQDKQLESVEQIIDWSGLGLKTVSNTYDAIKQRDIAASVNGMLEGVGEALGDVLKRSGVPEDTADLVASTYQSAIQVPKVTGCLIKNPPDKSGALDALGAGFESAFQAAFPDSKQLQRVGAAIAVAFTSSGKAIDIQQAWDEERYEDVVTALEEVTNGAVSKIFEVRQDEETEGLEDEEKTAKEEEIDREKTAALEEFARPDEVGDALATLREVSPGEIIANVRQQQDQDAVMAIEQTRQEVEEMRRLLQQGGKAGLSAAQASSIDKLIAQLVKDRMLIDIAAKIAHGGTALAAKFCPALEVANAAVKLATNIYAAALRAQELNKWVGSMQDLQRAQSALTSASQNFVRNQAEQFSHYTIQAAFEGVKIIGEVVALSGLSAHAGEAISKSAAAASEAEKLLYDFVRKEELNHAWKLTKKALYNPDNRRLGLQVRSLNPTLAKYTIAWGAITQNDPLAKNAVAKCGLNEITLSDEGSNVDKVVQYLEIYFREDLTLYREFTPGDDWVPSEIELTNASWSALKARAQQAIKLENVDTGKLDGLLSGLVLLQRDAQASDLEDMIEKLEGAQLERAAQLFGSVRDALDAYVPQCTQDGKKVMDGILRLLSRKASSNLVKTNRQLEQLAQTAA